MLKNSKNKQKKKGFTLIELIIVIAIIAILAALAIPKFSSVRQSANVKSDIANAKTIATATAALLTDGTITANETPIDLSGTSDDSNKIKGYLQTVPTPKAGNTSDKFIVKTKDNDVIVYIATPVTGDKTLKLDDSNQVYPEPGTTTNNIWYGGTPAKQ